MDREPDAPRSFSAGLRRRVRVAWSWLRRDVNDPRDSTLNVVKRVALLAGAVSAVAVAIGVFWSLFDSGDDTTSGSVTTSSSPSTSASPTAPPPTATSPPTTTPPTTAAPSTPTTTPPTTAPPTSTPPTSEAPAPPALRIDDVRIGRAGDDLVLDVVARTDTAATVTNIGVHDFDLFTGSECGGTTFVELSVAPSLAIRTTKGDGPVLIGAQIEAADGSQVEIFGDSIGVGGCSDRRGLVLRPQVALDADDAAQVQLTLPTSYEIVAGTLQEPGNPRPIEEAIAASSEDWLDRFAIGNEFRLFHHPDELRAVPDYRSLRVVSIATSDGACDRYVIDLTAAPPIRADDEIVELLEERAEAEVGVICEL